MEDKINLQINEIKPVLDESEKKLNDRKLNDKETVEGLEDLNQFVQEFINEQALYCITVIKSATKSGTEKMDCVDWILRNIEFASPKLVSLFIKTANTIKDTPDPAKTTLYFSEHTSEIIVSFSRLLNESIAAHKSDNLREMLPSYLSLLEIVLNSAFNRKLSKENYVQNMLIEIITDSKGFDKDTRQMASNCFALMSLEENVVNQAIVNDEFAPWIAFSVSGIGSELLESKSILMIILACSKSNFVTNKLLVHNEELAKELISLLNSSKSINEILELNLEILHQLTVQEKILNTLEPPRIIEVIIEISSEVPVEK